MNLRDVDGVLLISCYELGHQSWGIAFPLEFLKRAGFQPAALELAVESFDPQRFAAGLQERCRCATGS